VSTGTGQRGGATSSLPPLSEVKIGAFTVRPGGGVLEGRGLKMPKTTSVSITFTPPDGETHNEVIHFNVSKGRLLTIEVTGQGSFDEVEEHNSKLYQI
jgi:hypothetical protein